MSLPAFVRVGRWIVNPRRVIAVQHHDGERPPESAGDRTLMVLDDGYRVELTGEEAAGIWRIFAALVPADYGGGEAAQPEAHVILLGGANPRPVRDDPDIGLGAVND